MMKQKITIFFGVLSLLAGSVEAVTTSYTVAGANTWVAPAGVTSVTVEAWGGGGAGGAATGNPAKGGGGAGGQYVKKVVAVTPGSTYAISVGAGGVGATTLAGGVGGDSTFAVTSVVAKGGAGGGLAAANNSVGTAGLGSNVGGVGDVGFVFSGGSGSAAVTPAGAGGAGGGGAGTGGVGGSAVGNVAGTGMAVGGGAGGAGRTTRGTGNPGIAAGGGGGGGYATNTTDRAGGAGARGRVDLTYILPVTVTSINCVGLCSTTAATVSWTVTLNTAVTGLSAANFLLDNTGLDGAPAITGVTGSGVAWTVTASTGAGSGTLGLNMNTATGVTPIVTNVPFSGKVYAVRPVIYYHDTTAGVNIGFDGVTNVTAGANQVIPPIITASLSAANTCTSSARSASHPLGAYTHSRWYAPTNYTAITNIGANPSGSASLRGAAATDTVIVSLYDYDPVLGGKTLIGSSPAFALTGAGTTTTYPYTISSSLYSMAVGHRLMLQYDFTQAATTSNARVYCSATASYISVTEDPITLPTVVTSAATALTDTTATFNGTVSSNGASTAVSFEYGTSLGYGSTVAATPSPLAAGALSSAIAASITGLSCNTLYHFRAKGVNSVGTANGADVTFTTAACPAPPAVVSINMASANPTYPNTLVDWTVTFDQPVTGVDASDFLLVEGGGVTGATITGVSGSGTTWTVTANTGAGYGTLGVDLIDDDTITSTVVGAGVLGGAGLGNGDFALGQDYSVENPLCFSENFDRTAGLLSTGFWSRTKSVGTLFDAEIVGNRLRLTDAVGGRATAVHLNRLFPGAGNKVVAEFDYYAYGGSAAHPTGADGLAITLSDSATAPAAGAFGGSLGYAQKGFAPISDCNTVGGCPGFAGGWIGVGLDEYGNYSAMTEGRVDGPSAQANSVTVRGSGSGLSGYNYHTRSAVLTPAIAFPAMATLATPHRYRVIVDHSDGVHAYVSVWRDTNATCTIDSPNSCYVNVVPQYDAKAITSQAAVPPYWNFSFTSSTGSVFNIHEIDNFNVCTAKPIVAPTLHHVRIIHDGSALTCAPETVTLKACANAACDALYPGSVTMSVASTGGTWSANSVTFTGGQAQVTLSNTAVGSVTLSGAATAPSAMAAICYKGSTSGDCALVFSSNSCAFDAVEVGKSPSTPIFTKVAGTPFTVDVVALTAGVINTAYTGAVTVDLVDQAGVASGVCGTTSLAAPTVPPSPTAAVTAWTSGRRTYTFSAPVAAKDVRVRIVAGATTACSSDNFAIRPASFAVTSTNATNTATSGLPKFKAGAGAFALDATSTNGYTGTALINNYRIEAHSGAVQAGTISGTFSPATSLTSWISKGVAFLYSEVGNFRFLPWGVYDDGSFADVDRSKATPECVIDNKIGTALDPADPNVGNVDGKYGCYFGSSLSSSYFGRFIPDHFDTAAVGPMACASGAGCASPITTMVYSGQPLSSVVVSAKNKNGVTTQNYQGGFAQAVTLSAVASSGGGVIATGVPGGTLTSVAVPAIAFSGGSATLPFGIPTTHTSPTFTFSSEPASPTTPTNLFFRAEDADAVSSLRVSPNVSVEGGVRVVSGRVKFTNAVGSNSRALNMTAYFQYYDGATWQKNTNDLVTSLTLPNAVSLTGAAITSVLTTGSSSFTGGFMFTLQKPSASGVVSVNVNPTSAPTWMQAVSGTGKATFGVFTGKENGMKNFIYLRETYQ